MTASLNQHRRNVNFCKSLLEYIFDCAIMVCNYDRGLQAFSLTEFGQLTVTVRLQ